MGKLQAPTNTQAKNKYVNLVGWTYIFTGKQIKGEIKKQIKDKKSYFLLFNEACKIILARILNWFFKDHIIFRKPFLNHNNFCQVYVCLFASPKQFSPRRANRKN